jgi:hypothetical protein
MFNMGIRSLQGRTPLAEPELRPAAGSVHPLSLHLPHGTAAISSRHMTGVSPSNIGGHSSTVIDIMAACLVCS